MPSSQEHGQTLDFVQHHQPLLVAQHPFGRGGQGLPNDGTLEVKDRCLSLPRFRDPTGEGGFAHLTCPQQGDGRGFLQPKVDCGFERLPGYRLLHFRFRRMEIQQLLSS